MKHIQKLVPVPIERWGKIGDNIPVKEITVKSVPQKNISHQKNHVSQVKTVKVKKVKRLKMKNQLGKGKKQTQMFHFLTQEKKKKAHKLFHYVMKHKIFQLNQDGEIMQKEKTLHESNIVELITHAVENISSTPVGMKYFYRTLKRNKVPEKYISNKIGRKTMNKSLLDKTSAWRSPGHLNKNINLSQK